MGDFHVFLCGRAAGAGGIALNEDKREYVIRDVSTATEAERAALLAARGAGVQAPIVTGVFPWTQGKIVYPDMGGPQR